MTDIYDTIIIGAGQSDLTPSPFAKHPCGAPKGRGARAA